MKPLRDVFSLDGRQTVAEVLPIVIQKPYSRIPLLNKETNQFDKLLHLRNLLEAFANECHDKPIESIADDPLYVLQYLTIDDLFAKFRRNKRIFAIVVDEFGNERGIVTLEDLMEELVGEIYDESDLVPQDAEKISEDEIVLAGSAELRVIESLFEMELPGKPTDTVSLWILSHTENIPLVEEKFIIDDLEVKILHATSRSIEKVSVRRTVEADS